MSWKLIRFIAVFTVFLLFIIANLENRSNVNLGFVSFEDVPVFITAFCAFALGMALTIPYMAAAGRKKGKTKPAAADEGKKTRGKGAKNGTEAGEGKTETGGSDLADYGID